MVDGDKQVSGNMFIIPKIVVYIRDAIIKDGDG